MPSTSDLVICYDTQGLPISAERPERYMSTFDFCAAASFVLPNAGCICTNGRIDCPLSFALGNVRRTWSTYCIDKCYCQSEGTKSLEDVQNDATARYGSMRPYVLPNNGQVEFLPSNLGSGDSGSDTDSSDGDSNDANGSNLNLQGTCKTSCGAFFGGCGFGCNCKASLATLFFWYVGACAARDKPKARREILVAGSSICSP